MVDKLVLAQDETAIIDTTSNTATILCFSGTVAIKNELNQVIATLSSQEIYTLPIQTGKYQVVGGGSDNVIYVFRLFVY